MERQPLLQQVGNLVGTHQQDEEGQRSGGDHPIFLRVAHSPWRPLNQNALGYIRAALVAYLIATAGMLLDYEIKHRPSEYSNWRIPFQFSAVTWFFLIVYHVLVFSWTITHMHWPDIDANDTRWESRLLRFMSPPEQTADGRGRIYFSLFHVVTHVFALMNVIVYWTIQAPSGHAHLPVPGDGGDGGGDDGDGDAFMLFEDGPSKNPFKLVKGWFPMFILFNLYVFPALEVVAESVILNSMRRPDPVPTHLFASIGSAALYLGYAAIGGKLTGDNAFFWLDESIVGSKEKVTAYCTGFVALAAASFATLYGLVGMRESISDRAHSR
ncbi:hypothetical protein KVR01_009529 [Diaporthe batatas]|uniref:uncharacterized protein n=1 Tax=Diaporthe batatas TaxID=748121 RepID=UPI001D048BBA|nr:uncharacterized protein KVR01_009529 [Diaporthe batatas]KAG8161265.1 hypothetical protein KVR01_009529 [Diaporthe batatas]